MIEKAIFFSLSVLLVMMPQDSPRIIKVPGEFLKIQAAIDIAKAGETISISAGTYDERIVLKAGVSLIGDGPERTKIQGDGRGDIIVAADKAVISGFTIQNSGSLYCAIRSDSGSPVIKNNIIVRNGAGIVMADSYGVIERNLIVENDDGSDFGTIGILCRGGKPKIRNNTIANNHARFAVLCDRSCPEIVKNLIAFNLGGVGCVDGANPALKQNDLWANSVRGDYDGCAPDKDSLAQNPLFIDMRSGDYRLSPESPCLIDNRDIGMRGHKVVRNSGCFD